MPWPSEPCSSASAMRSATARASRERRPTRSNAAAPKRASASTGMRVGSASAAIEPTLGENEGSQKEAMVKRLWIAAFLLSAASAWAQQFPTRTVTIIVPYPPSGSNDVFARALGKKLSEAWKQPVIVDNKPGAGGAIGSAIVSKTAADGYTLLFLSSSFTTAAAIQPNLPFDPVAGFTPLASVAKGPMVLTVKNDL